MRHRWWHGVKWVVEPDVYGRDLLIEYCTREKCVWMEITPIPDDARGDCSVCGHPFCHPDMHGGY